MVVNEIYKSLVKRSVSLRLPIQAFSLRTGRWPEAGKNDERNAMPSLGHINHIGT